MIDDQTTNWEQTLFNIILHAGNARTKALEAAEKAEEGSYEEAEALLIEAENEQAASRCLSRSCCPGRRSTTPGK